MKQTREEQLAEQNKVMGDIMLYGTGVAFFHGDGSIHHMSLDRISIDGKPSPFIKPRWNNEPTN